MHELIALNFDEFFAGFSFLFRPNNKDLADILYKRQTPKIFNLSRVKVPSFLKVALRSATEMFIFAAWWRWAVFGHNLISNFLIKNLLTRKLNDPYYHKKHLHT